MEIDLKNVLSDKELSRKEKILLLLLAEGEKEKQVKDIKKLAISNGLREASKWNISQILNDLGNCAIKLPSGWSITNQGKDLLAQTGILKEKSPVLSAHKQLRKYLSKVTSEEVKIFIEEAISALEYGLMRSAVVLSWVGSVAILYDEVIKNHLSVFNKEAIKRNPKWKMADTVDDLAKLKEYDFLQIINGISLIGKNTKLELEQCLKLRNSCGHPNTFRIGEHRVASHIEVLILNVYQKFTT